MEAGVFEDEVVSMVDVLHEDDELEEEARAVLGDSDDQHCTYLTGYAKRQALYACSTCSAPDKAELAGICLACSLACHEGHTLYELYTKRNFRCDCGNKRFSNFKCKLFSQKDQENAANKYNQNFQGLYCTCHRPYPDLEDEVCIVSLDSKGAIIHMWPIKPFSSIGYLIDECNFSADICRSQNCKISFGSDRFKRNQSAVASLKEWNFGFMCSDIEDEMIQCIICEDWYHSRHLGNLPPAEGDFQEMICDECMKRCTFLQAYLSISVPHQTSSLGHSQQLITQQESEITLNVGQESQTAKSIHQEPENRECKTEEQEASRNGSSAQEPSKISETEVKKADVSNEGDTLNHVNKVEDHSSNGVVSHSQQTECKLVQLQASLTKITEGASYWHIGWRANLCTCQTCIGLYKSLDVSYLTDETDTMLAYEQRGREKRPDKSSYESGMQAFQNMGRIPQVEVMHEYNDMKAELTEYLREFATQGKVVKEEDIRNFFDSLQSRKRQRVGSANTVQYNCR